MRLTVFGGFLFLGGAVLFLASQISGNEYLLFGGLAAIVFGLAFGFAGMLVKEN